MKKSLVIVVLVFLTSCSGEAPFGGFNLYPGQWGPPMQVGDNLYVIEGYGNEEAIKGGKHTCMKLDGNFSFVAVSGGSGDARASLTFKC